MNHAVSAMPTIAASRKTFTHPSVVGVNDGRDGGPSVDATAGAERPAVPLPYVRPDPAEALAASEAFLGIMSTRRSVRQFSPEPVPVDLLVNAIATAGTAPSDEPPEPWTFVVVADRDVKEQVRESAGAGDYLTDAPYLVVVFEQGAGSGASKQTRDLVKASVGIATGFLLASLHMSGLATLVHKPGSVTALNRIVQRPRGERAFLVVAVGYPAADAVVPPLSRKPLADILHVVP